MLVASHHCARRPSSAFHLESHELPTVVSNKKVSLPGGGDKGASLLDVFTNTFDVLKGTSKSQEGDTGTKVSDRGTWLWGCHRPGS